VARSFGNCPGELLAFSGLGARVCPYKTFTDRHTLKKTLEWLHDLVGKYRPYEEIDPHQLMIYNSFYRLTDGPLEYFLELSRNLCLFAAMRLDSLLLPCEQNIIVDHFQRVRAVSYQYEVTGRPEIP